MPYLSPFKFERSAQHSSSSVGFSISDSNRDNTPCQFLTYTNGKTKISFNIFWKPQDKAQISICDGNTDSPLNSQDDSKPEEV